ncbi:uncharacterized protein LOC127838145 isoform X2 [Dreissena polymorpha]|uniref:uncharacterized protein LOC127838145 isoform X2 n=1 Tax=Dreissena polymorpha TaxID=45954 RepID=UPI002263E49A|nr:uncharacterized protein LOC127838145 isoform X2 [Dreissena polymorpha]
MWLYKLVCVFILATGTVKAESYYEINSIKWDYVKCKLGEPKLKYQNSWFMLNETLSISDEAWIGYIYAKVPFLLLGCASLQIENGVYVKLVSDCFVICDYRKFGIKRTRNGSGLLCICVMGSVDTTEISCKSGDTTSLCNNCSEIYTQIHVNASNVGDHGTKPEGDCLTYYYPYLRWQLCSRKDYIRAMCSNSTYAGDLKTTAMINDTTTVEWSAGNKLCLTSGRQPAFERSITNTGFTAAQQQYYWTGIFRANILIKLSLQECFSRVSTDSYAYVIRGNQTLYVSNNNDRKKALCVTGPGSMSTIPETCKYTTEVTVSNTLSTHSMTSDALTKVTTPDVTTMFGSTSRLPTTRTTQTYTTRQLNTTEATTDVTPLTTQSTYSETSVIVTQVTTPGVTTPVASKSSLSTTQMYTSLSTGYEPQTRNDGNNQGSKQNSSEKSTAVSIGIGVSVGILFLVGGAVVIVCLKRRGIVHCNRQRGNNKQTSDEQAFKENMTFGKSMEDNVANQTYFILEKCEQSIGNNAEHCYEHVKYESSYYDHTIKTLPSGSDARKPENVYNKLKIDRPGDNGHLQSQGLSVVQNPEDDYDTTSAVVTHGMDDVSDYNHIPRAAYKARATGDNVIGNEGGNYDAINNVKFKVAQSDSYEYAHVH